MTRQVRTATVGRTALVPIAVVCAVALTGCGDAWTPGAAASQVAAAASSVAAPSAGQSPDAASPTGATPDAATPSATDLPTPTTGTDAATPTAGPTGPTSSALPPATAPITPSTTTGTVPAAFLGSWNAVKAACGTSSEGALEITATKVTFYESSGPYLNARLDGPVLVADLRLTGEGVTGDREYRFAVSRDGQKLTDIDSGLVRYRCG